VQTDSEQLKFAWERVGLSNKCSVLLKTACWATELNRSRRFHVQAKISLDEPLKRIHVHARSLRLVLASPAFLSLNVAQFSQCGYHLVFQRKVDLFAPSFTKRVYVHFETY